MRIEGTHLFAAPIDRVFALFADPDLLQHTIPGCERLIQFGPPDADGGTTLQARLRPLPGADVYTLDVTAASVSEHVRLEASGRGPAGLFWLRGTVDFAPQDERTVVTYAVETGGAGLPDDGRAGQRFAGAITRRVDSLLAARDADAPVAPAPGNGLAAGQIARTPLGHISVVPGNTGQALQAALAQRAAIQRAVWMSAGLLVGLTAIGLTFQLVRRFDANHLDHANHRRK